MKLKNWLLFYGCIICYDVALAQGYVFQVMISKGDNKVKSGNAWQAVKTGTSLRTSDELKLSNNSFVGLLHTSGKLVQVKEAGMHNVADLTNKLTQSASLLGKCATYMLSDNIKIRRLNNDAYGGVHRGPKDSIELYLPAPPSRETNPKFNGIFGEEIIIHWEAKGSEVYVIEFQNMFQDVIARYETKETSLLIDLEDPKLSDKKWGAILVKVASKNNPQLKSSYKFLRILAEEEKIKIKTWLPRIGTNFDQENAMTKLAMAGFYEEHDLVIDAITSYQQAIRLAPDVPDFKMLYEDFLFRKGLKVSEE